jgi:Uncharacterized protein conserved in bacteria (DUF2252)
MARKVVGVGNAGTRCWILLMLGRDESDQLFVQSKDRGVSAQSVRFTDVPVPSAGSTA